MSVKELRIPEFSSKVILVHPFQGNSLLNIIYNTGRDHLVEFDEDTQSFDLIKTTVNAFIKDDEVLSNQAVIGSHLNFEKHQYSRDFIDRPHVHWWWNGLFQANSGGDWETSYVAILEPMSAHKTVYGCAYYDTMTIGPHRLSKDSCIVVPEQAVAPLKARLKDYQGGIVGFNPKEESIRTAISRTIAAKYPEALELVDHNGVNINTQALTTGSKDFNHDLARAKKFNCSAGYFNSVEVKTKDGLVPLIKGSSDILLEDYKKYARGRYVGLHSSAPTDVEYNHLIKILKQVSLQPANLGKYSRNFIGNKGEKCLDELCIIEAFQVNQRLKALDKKTGTHSYADYLVKKALLADLRSITQIPSEHYGLLIEKNYASLYAVLENISNFAVGLKGPGYTKEKQLLINDYRKQLQSLFQEPSLAATCLTMATRTKLADGAVASEQVSIDKLDVTEYQP